MEFSQSRQEEQSLPDKTSFFASNIQTIFNNNVIRINDCISKNEECDAVYDLLEENYAISLIFLDGESIQSSLNASTSTCPASVSVQCSANVPKCRELLTRLLKIDTNFEGKMQDIFAAIHFFHGLADVCQTFDDKGQETCKKCAPKCINFFESRKYSKESFSDWKSYVGKVIFKYSQFALGIIYCLGFGIEQNIKIGCKFLKQAAEEFRISHAFFFLGLVTLYKSNDDGGNFEKEEIISEKNDSTLKGKDYLKGLNYLEISAEMGNKNAQCRLYEMYKRGIIVEKNAEMAEKYIRMFAASLEKGDDNESMPKIERGISNLTLAWMYLNGRLVERDEKKALHYFDLAANEDKEVDAFYVLGHLNEVGRAVPMNIQKAVEFYKQCPTKDAYFRLGQIYQHNLFLNNNQLPNQPENSDPVKADSEKSMNYFKLAAKCGHHQALLKFGCHLSIGNSCGVKFFEKNAKENEQLIWFGRILDEDPVTPNTLNFDENSSNSIVSLFPITPSKERKQDLATVRAFDCFNVCAQVSETAKGLLNIMREDGNFPFDEDSSSKELSKFEYED